MIQLKDEHLQQIISHAEATYPQECCGLILGKISQEAKFGREIIPTENSWNPEDFQSLSITQGSKKDRFSIAPEVLLKIQKQARDRNLSIIGVYHSHPDHEAIPSEIDQKIAWSDYSYIIASVQQGKVTDISSWKLDHQHQFQSEKIKII